MRCLSKIAKAGTPVLQPLHGAKEWLKTLLTSRFPCKHRTTGKSATPHLVQSLDGSEYVPEASQESFGSGEQLHSVQEEPDSRLDVAEDDVEQEDNVVFISFFSNKAEVNFVPGPSQIVNRGHNGNEWLALYSNADLAQVCMFQSWSTARLKLRKQQSMQSLQCWCPSTSPHKPI